MYPSCNILVNIFIRTQQPYLGELAESGGWMQDFQVYRCNNQKTRSLLRFSKIDSIISNRSCLLCGRGFAARRLQHLYCFVFLYVSFNNSNRPRYLAEL